MQQHLHPLREWEIELSNLIMGDFQFCFSIKIWTVVGFYPWQCIQLAIARCWIFLLWLHAQWAIPFNKHTPPTDAQLGYSYPLDLISLDVPPWHNLFDFNPPIHSINFIQYPPKHNLFHFNPLDIQSAVLRNLLYTIYSTSTPSSTFNQLSLVANPSRHNLVHFNNLDACLISYRQYQNCVHSAYKNSRLQF